MQEQSTEQRLSNLEDEVAELKQIVTEQITKLERASDVDTALLIRIDSFIGDLHRVERDQKAGFQELRSGQQELRTDMTAILKTHKQAIEELAAGQRQIISLLTGEGRLRNN